MAHHQYVNQCQCQCRPNIRKADVAVAWRALHCQLRTPSFLTYCRYKSGAVGRSGDTPMQRACCRWPACRTPLATDPTILQPTTIATTTHILLHCPLTQPAAQWLCDLWAAIDDGNTPPATPDAIIAGDPTAWRPAHLETELWTRLRVTYLQKAWDAHCVAHNGGPAPSPTSIAAATLHAAVQSMRTEFIAAFTAPTELAQQCDAHMFLHFMSPIVGGKPQRIDTSVVSAHLQRRMYDAVNGSDLWVIPPEPVARPNWPTTSM